LKQQAILRNNSLEGIAGNGQKQAGYQGPQGKDSIINGTLRNSSNGFMKAAPGMME